MNRAILYKKLDSDIVQCRACSHFCRIAPGEQGRCGVRENVDGTLFTRVYDRVAAAAVDPIEKKPLFHVRPGSFSYSVATVGCNFRCRFCQNSDIAQWPADRRGESFPGRPVTPEHIVQEALTRGCDSISFTYTEPSVYIELAFDTATLAREKGLLTVFVTNGFMGPALVDQVAPVLSAANVDLKSFSDDFYDKYCGGKLSPVKTNLVRLRERGVVVEVTTLLIPGLNDDPKELRSMADFICRELGPGTPWHLSRFHPAYRLTDRGPTPRKVLDEAFEIGRGAGLYYVYTGNLSQGHEDTFCHACGATLVTRHGFGGATSVITKEGACPGCGTGVYGIF